LVSSHCNEEEKGGRECPGYSRIVKSINIINHEKGEERGERKKKKGGRGGKERMQALHKRWRAAVPCFHLFRGRERGGKGGAGRKPHAVSRVPIIHLTNHDFTTRSRFPAGKKKEEEKEEGRRGRGGAKPGPVPIHCRRVVPRRPPYKRKKKAPV